MVRIWSASSVLAISAGGLSFDSLHTRCTASGITPVHGGLAARLEVALQHLVDFPRLVPSRGKTSPESERSHRLVPGPR